MDRCADIQKEQNECAFLSPSPPLYFLVRSNSYVPAQIFRELEIENKSPRDINHTYRGSNRLYRIHQRNTNERTAVIIAEYLVHTFHGI